MWGSTNDFRKLQVELSVPASDQDARSHVLFGAEGSDHSVLLDGIRLLDQLNPDQREALTLTKYAGYTVAEAATCCGVSHTAMKVRVFRAMRETRKILQREEIPA